MSEQAQKQQVQTKAADYFRLMNEVAARGSDLSEHAASFAALVRLVTAGVK